jgi:hypothetical protein
MLIYYPIDFRLSRGVSAMQWWEQTRKRYAACPGGHPNSPSCGHPKFPHLTMSDRG